MNILAYSHNGLPKQLQTCRPILSIDDAYNVLFLHYFSREEKSLIGLDGSTLATKKALMKKRGFDIQNAPSHG